MANLPNLNTRETLANQAGVSPRTMGKADAIYSSDAEDLKQNLDRGHDDEGRKVSIDSEYKKLRARLAQAEQERDKAKHDAASAQSALDASGASMFQMKSERDHAKAEADRLREALEPLAGSYDFAILDTPPNIGIVTKNALAAADYVVVPAQADAFSVSGIEQIGKTIAAIRHYYNHGLQVKGILLTRFNPRITVSKIVRERIEGTADELETKLFDATIREAAAVKEAQLLHLSIFEHEPRSNVAKDYEAFCKELLGGIM